MSNPAQSPVAALPHAPPPRAGPSTPPPVPEAPFTPSSLHPIPEDDDVRFFNLPPSSCDAHPSSSSGSSRASAMSSSPFSSPSRGPSDAYKACDFHGGSEPRDASSKSPFRARSASGDKLSPYASLTGPANALQYPHQVHEQKPQLPSLLVQMQGHQEALRRKEMQECQQSHIRENHSPQLFLERSPSDSALGLSAEVYGSDGGRGVQRMWEGGIYDCGEDSAMASQTACCPCVTFGENMAMAGFGHCPTQALLYFVLTYGACTTSQLLGIWCSNFDFFSTLGFGLYFMGTAYAAHFRTELRKRFNIYGDESTDCMHHAFCSCCALCQENRTLKVNNVHKGVWSGRGDIGNVVVQHRKSWEMEAPLPIKMTSSSSSSSLPSLKDLMEEIGTSLSRVATATLDISVSRPAGREALEQEMGAMNGGPFGSGLPTSTEAGSFPRSHPFASPQRGQSAGLLRENIH